MFAFDSLLVAANLVGRSSGLDWWTVRVGEAVPFATYQHSKEIVTVVGLAALALRLQNSGYWFWTGVFTYFLLDDLVDLRRLAAFGFGTLAGRDTSLGNPAAGALFTVAVAIAASVILVLLLRRKGPQFARDSMILLAIVAGLAVFGVILNDLDLVLDLGDETRWTMVLLEAAGELYFLTLATWFVLRRLLSTATPGASADRLPSDEPT